MIDYGLDTHKMDTFLAYVAGFFEGEGCVMIVYKQNGRLKYKTYALAVVIGNANKIPLEKIQHAWGGSIQKHMPISIRHKIQYRLEIYGDNAENLLRNIRPFLLFKQKEVDLALEFRRFKKTEPHYGSGHPKSKISSDYQEYLHREIQIARNPEGGLI